MTRGVLRFVLIAALLVPGLTHADSLEIAGDLVQGGLIRGRVPPDSVVFVGDRRLRVTPDGWFVFGLGRDAPASIDLRVTSPRGEERIQSLEVASRTYVVQRIDGLPPQTVTPGEAELERIRADAALLAAARERNTGGSGFLGAFVWPAQGPISGVYGSQRILNGKPRSPHRGVDIAAPRGTPVGAMAQGEVSLAEDDMYFTGGTVMVDHGHGLQSIYVHLDEVRVTVNQRLGRGQILGTVGSTGRATGPHLHWGVYWFDEAIDPALLVDAMRESKGEP